MQHISENEILLKLSALSIGYSGRKHRQAVVASGLNASLHRGRLTCLLGPNGAGKSTLLKTICGFIKPIKGEVEIKGRNISAIPFSDTSKLISVVLTEKPEVVNMTVASLVGLGRSPYNGFWGSLSQRDRTIVEDALRKVGIANLANRYITTLSDGERQKAMIAKALAQETPIVLLDEPTAFLDYPSKIGLMRLLQALARDELKTFLVSIHDLEIALRLADTIWLLGSDGTLICGNLLELVENGDIERCFSLTPEDMRFISKI